MRSIKGGFAHWCPACEEMHPLPDSWVFDGNLNSPTFTPSFKHTGKQTIKVNGKWTGEWVHDSEGKLVDYVCHYNVTAGNIQFHADCTHALAGKTVPLPPLPEYLTD